MNPRSKIEKWILADWSSSRNPELARTEEVAVKCENNEVPVEKPYPQRRSKGNGSGTGSGSIVPEEDKDFSPSASSWEPSGNSSSEDSDHEVSKTKTLKMEQYIRQYVKRRNGKKILTPIHRPNAVVNVLQERQININNRSLNDVRKRKYVEIPTINKSLPDSTQKKISPPKETYENISISTQTIIEMKKTFEELFKLINDMKPESARRVSVVNDEINVESINKNPAALVSNVKTDEPSYDTERSERSLSEESNRSNDNVLISNKYHKIETLEKKQENENEEWIPIGSGKTLIHKDKYRKINWKSYTIATRTLLLATFPRRILATHSLTGKRSPAFQNKPAKMCLDPKIVSDIIIEITTKFKVKENLVRGIITTKCADECKMLKQRLQSKKSKKGAPNTKFKGESIQ